MLSSNFSVDRRIKGYQMTASNIHISPRRSLSSKKVYHPIGPETDTYPRSLLTLAWSHVVQRNHPPEMVFQVESVLQCLVRVSDLAFTLIACTVRAGLLRYAVCSHIKQ